MNVFLICKSTHNHFLEGKKYTGNVDENGNVLILTKDTFGYDKKWYYTKERVKRCDCIKTWFWTI